MESANVENCPQNDSNDQSVSNNAQRPVFIPCSNCGHKFTKRALEVHHQTCSEDENCNCYVCKFSKRKFLKTNQDFNNAREEFSKKSIHNGGKNLNLRQISKQQNILTDQVSNFAKVCPDAPNSANIAIENINMKDKLDDALPNGVCDAESIKVHPDGKPCSRKLFCNFCKEHCIPIEFGTHTLQHCRTDENNIIQCPECSITCSSPKYFLLHYFFHISPHRDCPQCKCDLPECSNNNKTKREGHLCYICKKSFTNFYLLGTHMESHTKVKTYDCPICKRSYRRFGNLKRHITKQQCIK